MALFPIRRPNVGLHVSAEALTLVQVGREWRRAGRGWRLRRCRRTDLPGGLVRISPGSVNLTDLPAMARHLKNMAQGLEGSCVALSLPDSCARIALFDFETLPQKSAEIEALLRFRYQKDHGVVLGEGRLDYRVFRPKAGTAGPIRILAGAVRLDILTQYEHLCEQAGLIPSSIGLSSLSLFDACVAAMTTSSRDALFLHMTEQGFAFFAFQQGNPVFLRVKSCLPGADPSAISPAVQEVLATLHYYTDHCMAATASGSPRACPLYLVKSYGHHGSHDGEADQRDPLADPHAQLQVGILADALSLSVMTLDWNVLRITSAAGREPLPRSGLSALAAIWAA